MAISTSTSNAWSIRVNLCVLTLTVTLFNSMSGSAQTSSQHSEASDDATAHHYMAETRGRLKGSSHSVLRDAVVRGTISDLTTPDNPDGTFILYVNPRDFHLAISRGSTRSEYSVQNGRGVFRKNDVRIAIAPSATVDMTSYILPLFDRWQSLVDAGASISNDGSAEDNGESCHLVTVDGRDTAGPTTAMVSRSLRTGSLLHLKLCGDSNELREVKMTVQLGNNPALTTPVTFRYEHYTELSGASVPTLITRSLYGKPIMIFHITSISFNQNLDDAALAVSEK